MLKKSLIAAGLIAAAALLTACGSKTSEQSAQETAVQTETVVAKEQTETAAEKVITDKNVVPKPTDAAEPETTTKAEETETVTPAGEEETTTQEAQETQGPTQAYAVPQSENEGEQGEMADLSAFFGVVSAEGGLTLRDGPASDYNDLTLIPDGTEIAIEEVQDGWGRVDYDGMSGWVSLDYVE